MKLEFSSIAKCCGLVSSCCLAFVVCASDFLFRETNILQQKVVLRKPAVCLESSEVALTCSTSLSWPRALYTAARCPLWRETSHAWCGTTGGFWEGTVTSRLRESSGQNPSQGRASQRAAVWTQTHFSNLWICSSLYANSVGNIRIKGGCKFGPRHRYERTVHAAK